MEGRETKTMHRFFAASTPDATAATACPCGGASSAAVLDREEMAFDGLAVSYYMVPNLWLFVMMGTFP